VSGTEKQFIFGKEAWVKLIETEGKINKPRKKGGNRKRERRENMQSVTNQLLLQACLMILSAESWGQSLKPEDNQFIPN
jgi:hypothetical protein